MTIKKISLLIIAQLFVLSIFAQGLLTPGGQKIENLLQLINYAYVDSTDEERITEAAIVALLKELDPHSVYIPEKELKKMNEPLIGNFEGVGIQFNILHDTLVVVSPIPGGPFRKSWHTGWRINCLK